MKGVTRARPKIDRIKVLATGKEAVAMKTSHG